MLQVMIVLRWISVEHVISGGIQLYIPTKMWFESRVIVMVISKYTCVWYVSFGSSRHMVIFCILLLLNVRINL
ncbi:hypothetical protein HanIR_Chr02g0057801 [Helianthus annuus]|nr:hypothetical protein HanIR_Chr02g0057801 [Helianthus annuus]